MLTMFDRAIASEWVVRLEAFKGGKHRDVPWLTAAVTEFISRGGFVGIDAQAFNKLIEAILAHELGTVATKTKPTASAWFRAQQIRPWVEDIRKTLFATESPPFGCVEDAEKWMGEMEEYASEWRGKVDEWINHEHERYTASLCVLAERYPSITKGIEAWGSGSSIPTELSSVDAITLEMLQHLSDDEVPRHLSSLRPKKPPEEDDCVRSWQAFLSNMLEICRATGFTAKSVEMHILTDAPLVLPPFRIAVIDEPHLLPSGASLKNRYANVTVQGEMTFDDLRYLYRQVRRVLGLRRLKPFKKKSMQLYEVVVSRGTIPQTRGEVESFWESVRKEYNALNPAHKYKTWKVVKITYERIVARLERRMIQKGGTT